jgi:hypothetical protein
MGEFTYQNDLLPLPLELLAITLAVAATFAVVQSRGEFARYILRGCSNRLFWILVMSASALVSIVMLALEPTVLPWGGLDRYLARAVNIASHGVYGDGEFSTAWFPPGYSFLLLPLAWALGDSRWVFFVTNSLLLMAFTLGTRFALRTSGAQVNTANLLSLAIFLYPNRLFSVLLPFSDIPFSLMAGTALLLLALRRDSAGGRPSAIAIGVIGGCASLIRSTGLAMAPALLAGVLVTAPPLKRERLIQVLLVSGMFVLVLLPWLARNWRVTGEIVPVSLNGGVNIAIGNNPSGSTTFNTFHDSVWNEEKLQSVLGNDWTSEVRRDSLFRAVGIECIRTHPGAFLWKAVGKVGRTFAADNHAFSGLVVYTNGWVLGASLGRRWGASGPTTAILQTVTATAFTLVVLINSGLYYALLAWTAASFFSGVRSAGLWRWVFPLVLLGTCALVSLTFGLSRFKEPVGMMMVLYALTEFVRRPADQGRGDSPPLSERG